MSERAEKLKPVLAELSSEEREELFDYFRDRQGPDENLSPDEWEDAWVDEINRRVKAYENGVSTGMPADEFMAKMKEKYG